MINYKTYYKQLIDNLLNGGANLLPPLKIK
jgi:hypothetical protein